MRFNFLFLINLQDAFPYLRQSTVIDSFTVASQIISTNHSVIDNLKHTFVSSQCILRGGLKIH